MKAVFILFATILVIGSVWAGNSWDDENDVDKQRYDPLPPVFQPPMFNFNPNTPRIFGTKYFGNAPSYLFKPLPPVFAPHVQRRPPPVRDATTLCSAIMCSAPATCRLVQSCPTCAPKPVCMTPATVPQNFDQSCQMHGYRQAVMLHHLSPTAGMAAALTNPSATTSLRCIPWLPTLTRGGCSQGATCVPYTQPGAPAGTGTCCAGPIASPVSIRSPVAPMQAPMVPPVSSLQTPLTPQAALPQIPVVPPAISPQIPMVSPVAPPLTAPAHPQRQDPLVNLAAAATPMMHSVIKPGVCPSVMVLPGSCSAMPCMVDSDCGSYLKCCPNSCGGRSCIVP